MVVPSTKPYMLRAIYDWCIDNHFTPHVLVRSDDETRVPNAKLKKGEIVLNISPSATPDLLITNDALSCSLRFSGVVHGIYVPINAIVAVLARENGHGVSFDANTAIVEASSNMPAQQPTKTPRTMRKNISIKSSSAITDEHTKSEQPSKVTLRIVE